MTAALAEPMKLTRTESRLPSRTTATRTQAKTPRFAMTQTRPLRQSSEMLPKLIADHQAEVWRYLRVVGCPADLADDLTQEAFVNAFKRPFTYRGKTAAAAYLRRAAYHRYLNHLRSKHQTTELGDTEVSNVTWMRWHDSRRNDAEVLTTLEECLEKLPERDRLALELRFRDGRSRQEIALALSMSEHGAKNLMQRAKKKLLRAMESRLGRTH